MSAKTEFTEEDIAAVANVIHMAWCREDHGDVPDSSVWTATEALRGQAAVLARELLGSVESPTPRQITQQVDKHTGELVAEWQRASGRAQRVVALDIAIEAVEDSYGLKPPHRVGQWFYFPAVNCGCFAQVTRITKGGVVYGRRHYRTRDPGAETVLLTAAQARAERSKP